MSKTNRAEQRRQGLGPKPSFRFDVFILTQSINQSIILFFHNCNNTVFTKENMTVTTMWRRTGK